MGNIKSISYNEAIDQIKKLEVSDFHAVKIFDKQEFSLLYPIHQMSLFALERCLRDDINNNFMIHDQIHRFQLNVFTRNGYNFVQVSMRPTLENIQSWLKYNMKNIKQLLITVPYVRYDYYKLAESSLQKVCEMHSWKFEKKKTFEKCEITTHITISI